MFKFPQGLYTDVRIEDVFEAQTKLKDGSLKENKQRLYKGVFIRIFDGDKWYYSSTTDVDSVNEAIASLAQMTQPKEHIEEHPIVKQLEVNQVEDLKYETNTVRNFSKRMQEKLLLEYGTVLNQQDEIKEYVLIYKARSITKSFYSSKGTSIVFDKQTCGLVARYTVNVDGKRFDDGYDQTGTSITQLQGLQKELEGAVQTSIEYIKQATAVKPGKYTVVFSPKTTGVFAHESFGHKSEADFMLGSEAMKKEWCIGKSVGVSELSIIDRGDIEGAGYIPFDDEGNRCRVNYLIKDGILAGRLHTASTAEALGEQPTGNGRSMNFEFEPIVRMTTTYVDKGPLTKEELFAGVEDGIYVEDFSHGSGMTAFTIAPRRAYRIRYGKVAEPIMVSVVTGNVMETLHLIDGISDEVELFSFSMGGCGKMEQYPLPVGFGGPYIRVQNLNVQ